MNLGIDFGRVIHGGLRAPGDQDTAFLDGAYRDALASPPTEGVYDVLPHLVELFDGRAWIISKCGARVRERTLAWLDHHDFYARVGLPRGNVRFCRRRADKLVHCRELGITHMIDDRPDVHRAIAGAVPHRFLFGPQRGAVPNGLPNPLSWAEAGSMITETVRARPGMRPGRAAPATPRSP